MFQIGNLLLDCYWVKKLHFIWPTHHLTYFTPNTLKHFFENLGFTLLHWETKLDLIDIDWYLNHINDNKSKFFKNNLEKNYSFLSIAQDMVKNLRMIFKNEIYS